MYYMKSIGINSCIRYTVHIVCIKSIDRWLHWPSQTMKNPTIFSVQCLIRFKFAKAAPPISVCIDIITAYRSACSSLLLLYENHINMTSNHFRYCWSEIDEGWVRRMQTYINTLCLILRANGMDKFSFSQMSRMPENYGRHSCIHPKKACSQFNVCDSFMGVLVI